VPVPLPFDQDGKTAFEGRILEGTTGRVLVKFAEERTGSGDKMDVQAMTVGKYQSDLFRLGRDDRQNAPGLDLGSSARQQREKSAERNAYTKQLIGMAI